LWSISTGKAEEGRERSGELAVAVLEELVKLFKLNKIPMCGCVQGVSYTTTPKNLQTKYPKIIWES
jgi:hypothetical protein